MQDDFNELYTAIANASSDLNIDKWQALEIWHIGVEQWLKAKYAKKKLPKKFSVDSIEYRLANYLHKFIKKRNPKVKKPNLQVETKNISLMIKNDGRDPNDIKTIIEWCQKDIPDKHLKEPRWRGWANNILCTKKLRDKFDELYLRMDEENQSARGKNNDDRFKSLRKGL